MARLTVVGVFVLRIFQPAPGIADIGVDDPWHSAQDLLHPPEAASGKHSHLGLALPGDSRGGAAVRLLHFGSFHVSSPVSAPQLVPASPSPRIHYTFNLECSRSLWPASDIPALNGDIDVTHRRTASSPGASAPRGARPRHPTAEPLGRRVFWRIGARPVRRPPLSPLSRSGSRDGHHANRAGCLHGNQSLPRAGGNRCSTGTSVPASRTVWHL